MDGCTGCVVLCEFEAKLPPEHQRDDHAGVCLLLGALGRCCGNRASADAELLQLLLLLL